MKLNHAVAVLMFWVCIFAASGSAFAQRLYPVEGPIASQTPQPVFKGHISHPIFGVSPLFMLLRSWTVANGEVLQGKPKKVKASSVNNPVPSASAPPQPNLAFAWDAVYGPGYFVGHILGKDMGQGVFTGKKGTVLQVESLDGEKGVAVDNQGNIYKMVWR
jgi:hypothetical protein